MKIRHSIFNIQNSIGGFIPSLENGIALFVLSLNLAKTFLRKLKVIFSKLIFPKQRKTMPFFSAGFTLIELLVTITIFVLLTGIVLFNQNGFNNGILLKNLAYDIALNIKQAQTYGIAVRESQTVSTFSSYGVYFDLANNKNFILFSDTNSSGIFNGNPSCPVGDAECIQKYSISRGSYIKDICINSDASCGITKLTILFKKPNPNAIMSAVNSQSNLSNLTSAKIIISSASGATSSVIVTNVGQIYVQ